PGTRRPHAITAAAARFRKRVTGVLRRTILVRQWSGKVRSGSEVRKGERPAAGLRYKTSSTRRSILGRLFPILLVPDSMFSVWISTGSSRKAGAASKHTGVLSYGIDYIPRNAGSRGVS